MLTRAVTTRKPWVCDRCGREQPAGTVAHWRRADRWIPVFGTAVYVRRYGDVRLCDACARGGTFAIVSPDFWLPGDELRTESPR